MTARDELQTIIHNSLTHPEHGEFALDSLRTAARVLEAGWRPPAVIITSENGLESLKLGTVVLDADGDVYRNGYSGGRPCWMQAGPQGRFRTVALPATVLHESGVSE